MRNRKNFFEESPDPFGNQQKTKLMLTSSWLDGEPVLRNFMFDYQAGMAEQGFNCTITYTTIDELEAASLACTHPGFNAQLDFDNDRDAYGEMRSKIPHYFLIIMNGDRIEQFRFTTWDPAEMPTLFEEISAYVHYLD